MEITSSAIKKIGFRDNQVYVTFTNDRQYLYNCNDIEGFNNDLKDVVTEGESVGKFINRAIRAQLLQAV